MHYEVKSLGKSRSFPDSHPFIENATAGADILVLTGPDVSVPSDSGRYKAVLVELDQKCLAAHPGVDETSTNVLGFSRWQLGELTPSNLVELVRLDSTSEDALSAARTIFAAASFEVSVCADRAGRIVDRLIRP